MTKLNVPLDDLMNTLWEGLGIEATIIDDTFNDLYLRVTGFEGAVVEFYVPITREGLEIDDTQEMEIIYWNEREMPYSRRNVAQRFHGLSDTFDVARKIVELVG